VAASSPSPTTATTSPRCSQLVGASQWELPFAGENGAELLGRAFGSVERREAEGTVTLRDAAAIRRYLFSSQQLRSFAERVPELEEPLVARRRSVVFVAEP
jgi:hypothetical protein